MVVMSSRIPLDIPMAYPNPLMLLDPRNPEELSVLLLLILCYDEAAAGRTVFEMKGIVGRIWSAMEGSELRRS